MNEFLDRIWMDNTIRSYLVVTGIILFVVIVKRYIAHYLASFLFGFIHRIWKDVDRKSFTSLVSKPMGVFLAVFVSIAILYKLHFPPDLNIDIYEITLKQILHAIGSLLIIVSFIRLLLRIIDFIALLLHIRGTHSHDLGDNQLIVFFKDFFKVVLAIIGLLMVLQFSFGLNISNLLTGLSIVGAAIALSLRESLENLIASFIIFFDKPFSTGDVVKVQNFSGTVEKIGLRSTRIRTDQKTYVTVPNKQMVDSILDNLSLRTQRKGELRLEAGLSTNSALLEEFINGIRKILERKDVESASVLLNDITSSAFTINADYYTGPITQAAFNEIKEKINFEVLKLMEQLKIEIAGSSTDIRLAGQSVNING